MEKVILYPGTFDPMTNGHVDLVERAIKIFPRLIIGVAENPHKKPRFPWQKRIDLAKEVLAGIPRVEVTGFDNLLVDFARDCGAKVILRGLRAVSDFEYEFQLAGMNRKIAPDLETLFLTPSEQYAYISSTLVVQIASLGGDVTEFVPAAVKKALLEI